MTLKDYTVILLTPDYAADDRGFGQDTKLAYSTSASSPQEAVDMARAMAADDEPHDPEDYFVIAVFEGVHANLRPER